jgi:hypothetical protein
MRRAFLMFALGILFADLHCEDFQFYSQKELDLIAVLATKDEVPQETNITLSPLSPLSQSEGIRACETGNSEKRNQQGQQQPAFEKKSFSEPFGA